MPSLQDARPARRGFTLLESLIVVAVVALLASAAIPMASKALSSAARKATRTELVQLGVAAQDCFRETGAAPASIEDLKSGHYLPETVAQGARPALDPARDAWSRAYRFKRSGDVLSITSAGPDAAMDTPDDVHILVDFTPIRREQTLAELEAIQRAITLHDGLHGSDTPRPATWSAVLCTLVEGGFLESAEPYGTDAWGNPYEARPEGTSRLGRIVSTSIAAGPAAAGAPVATAR